MKSTAVRVRVSAAIAVLAIVATVVACTNSRDSHRTAPQATPTATGLTTVVSEPPTVRPSCEVAVPAAWQATIEGSGVNAGGVSTGPLAVGRAGEVAAVRDNGDTSDLLLIGADKSVSNIYAVPDPNLNGVGFVAMDDRWIVVGVDRSPRGSNGVLPGLIRIDVLDRQGGKVRTVAQSSEADYTAGRNTLDSVALFGGKVYWITRETYAGDTGTVRSYDLGTGAVAEVASGAARDLRVTAAGLAWRGQGKRAEVKIPAPLPQLVADAPGIGQDRVSLATDGTAYAWITGLDQGGTGIAWWSPGSGLVRVTGKAIPSVTDWLPPVYVAGPYTLIGAGSPSDWHTNTTVVDTRSGAVTYLHDTVAGADGGTIALHHEPGAHTNGKITPEIPGVVRSDALPPLSC